MLTPSAVQNAKPRTKPYKLTDERGMHLLVKPNGSRWWRFEYRRPDSTKRNTLSLGTFPDVSLRQARERRDEARRLVADGIDPGEQRRANKDAAADTFEAIAREWHTKNLPKWTKSNADKILRRFEKDIFPWLGSKPISKLTAPEILAMMRRIDERGTRDTAHRAHQNCGQ